jgi:Tfp pilus assembly protein PilX
MFSNKQKKFNFSQKGQILLIVVLVVVIASTVGLSLASRSITSLRATTEEADSQKALAAAEAGIERSIQGNVAIAKTNVLDSTSRKNSNYYTEVIQVSSSSFMLNGGNAISKDEGADIWFVDHNADGSLNYSSTVTFNNYLNLYWGTTSEVCGTSTAPAALEIIVVTRSAAGDVKSYRYAYDSCSRGNNFTSASSGTFSFRGQNFGNRTPEPDLAAGLSNIVLVRVVPLYKDTVIGVSACSYAGVGCTALPLQGYIINSTGTSGQANRKITVFKGFPQTYLPYMSYGLFVAN